MGKSVQFTDAGQVIGAYESRGVPRFAIFQDRQFLFKYEGEDLETGAAMLSDWLDLLKNSAAIYTVAVYEDADRITSKTPYDGSFNFRFKDQPDNYANGSRALGEIRDQVARLAERLDNPPAPDPVEDEGPEITAVEAWLDKIHGVVSHPVIQPLLPQILAALTGTKVPAIAGPGFPAGSAAGEVPDPVAGGLPPAVVDAVAAIIEAVPDGAAGIIRLGNIARTDPAKLRKSWKYLDLL